jgi:hypothetical protein
MRPTPLASAIELPVLEPGREERSEAGPARPSEAGTGREAALAGRRLRQPSADPKVRAALVEALGERSAHGSADPSEGGVLWVSAESAVPLGPLPAHAELVDLASIDLASIDLASIDSGLQRPAGGPGGSAGCVLEGVLEQAADPGALLGWAYHRLQPGGRLAVSVTRHRAPVSRRGRGSPTVVAQAGHYSPGEGLRAHLFREGFEEPRLRRVGTAIVVSARRSALLPPPQRSHRLSVVMPVYNEAATLDTTIALVLAKQIPGVDIDVVIVESNSTDGSRAKVGQYAEHPRVRVILEDRPQGKGHAVRAGLKAARGDFILIQDADMEYDVDDYDALLEPLRSCEVGFVLGMRTNVDGSWGLRDFRHHRWTSHVMNVGHVGFLTLFNAVYRQRLRDPFTMYKVMRRDCLYGLTFECDRFDFDWELTAKLVRAGYQPLEIPVTYRSRSFHEGKKIAFVRDPLTWIRACFKYRFVRLYPDD